jgi:hypothetical protein
MQKFILNKLKHDAFQENRLFSQKSRTKIGIVTNIGPGQSLSTVGIGRSDNGNADAAKEIHLRPKQCKK